MRITALIGKRRIMQTHLRFIEKYITDPGTRFTDEVYRKHLLDSCRIMRDGIESVVDDTVLLNLSATHEER